MGFGTTLTMHEKLQVALQCQREPRAKDAELMAWVLSSFGKSVSTSTVRRLRKRQPDDFRVANMTASRRRRVKFPELERRMVQFYLQAEQQQDQDAAVSDDALMAEAQSLKSSLGISDQQLRLSNGWLAKFKTRNGIAVNRLQADVEQSEAVQEFAVVHTEISSTSALAMLQELTGQYQPEDVYHFSESALFYRLEPEQELRAEDPRVTVALCCNATGSHKLEPVVIGTAANPRCFRASTRRRLEDKDVSYYYSKKTRMTASIFQKWLRSFDQKMASQDRKVLLLIEDTSSHNVFDQLSHVEVKYLPCDTAMDSCAKQLRAGVIRSFKVRYRHRYVRWCLDAIQADIPRKLSLLEALQFCAESWRDVSPECVCAGWAKTRIVTSIRYAGDYDAPADQDILNDLAHMLTSMNVDQSVDEYVDADVNVIVHELADENQEYVEAGIESDDDDPPVSPSTALKYCMELSSFVFQCEGNTSREQEMMSVLTELARSQGAQRRQQINGFLQER